MNISRLLLTGAVAGLAAAAAAAQQEEAPAETGAERPSRLSDLKATVDALLEEETQPLSSAVDQVLEDETQPISRAAQPRSEEPTSPEPVPSEPEASQPPPEPAQEPQPSEPVPGEPPVEASEPESAPPPEPESSPPQPVRQAAAADTVAPVTPIATAAASTATASAAPSRPAPPLTRSEIAEVERTAVRGRLLIEIARAGLLATQDMLTRVSDPAGAGITGWIAESEGNGMRVTFYAAGEGDPRAVYRASVLGGRVVSREIFLGADRPPLTPVQARMAAARAVTEGLDHEACSTQPFNVFVVPPASASAPIDVYQVTAPTQRGRYPLGGNFRTTIAPDGTVSATRGFTNRCLDVEAGPPVAGQAPQPLGITHLLDPMPTEIHVFLAMWSGRPLLVATGEPHRIWQVTDRIAEVRP